MTQELQEIIIPYVEVGCRDCKWSPLPNTRGLYNCMQAVRRHALRKKHRGQIRMVKTIVYLVKKEAE